jgi:GNAT superfamily N-acetyltransferase
MLSFQQFIVEPLDSAKHSREGFDCGVQALNDFIRSRARKEMDSGTSACFVIVPVGEPKMIAGYYTLSAATIQRDNLAEAVSKKLPRYAEFPATLLGRLARDTKFKGAKIGERLMASALQRSVRASKEVASWAIITDPKDDRAHKFYETFGFQTLAGGRLFIPMKAAAEWISIR